MQAPVAIGRSVRHNRERNLPARQREASGAVAQALAADSPVLAALLHAACGASWVSLQAIGQQENDRQSSSFAIAADGKPSTAERIERLFANDFAAAISLFANAEHAPAGEFARVRGVRLLAP
jgi:urocanate hydratase